MKKILFISTALIALTIFFIWPSDPIILDKKLKLTFTSGIQTEIGKLIDKPLLVNFWSINCPVCISEIPKISKLRQDLYPEVAEVIAVNIPQDPPPAIFHAIKKLGITYPVALDVQGEIARSIGGIKATPLLILVDKKGEVVYRTYGEINISDLKAKISSL